MAEKESFDPAKAARDILVETAKAQGEAAKAVTATVGAAKDAGSFLSRCLGDAPDELGKLLTDKMRIWRLENLERIAIRFKALKDRGLVDETALREIPFGDAYRLTDAASEEDDGTVQDLWARLIFNASRAESAVTVKKMYIDILKALGPAEATFLDIIYRFRSRYFNNLEELDKFNGRANEAAEASWRKISEADRRSAIQNLVRLRCATLQPFSRQHSGVLEQIDVSEDRYRPKPVVTINPDRFVKLIEDIQESIAVSAGVKEPRGLKEIPLYSPGGFRAQVGKITVPELNFVLTPLGLDLMRACNVEPLSGTEAEDAG